ncbi:hypothetical protein MNBD_ACTINO01-1356 [hydrothermal vent metagenome]|uniref:Peptidase S8/S53 domain-containing protein n=1 Tax=hydrothermal vent metagenome TaxID=652676 RepID=A0A3B0S383_9ZZZZ
MIRHRLLPLGALLIVLALGAAACSTSSEFDDPNDPLASEQYAIDQMNLQGAWERSDGEDVVIAIIDTGIDLDHPDLKDNIVPGWDWVDDDDTPNDENGHGTHVAGSAAAIGNNSIGVIGMAPRAKIMPLKVLGADGSGNSEDIAEAILWAVDNGADVINLSLGGSSDLVGRIYNKVDPTNAAIAEADRRGVVVVAAAGNDDTFLTAYNPETPVIVVNASNEIGETARFSNFGDPRAVSAPGTRIMSTAPTYRTTIWPKGSNGYEELDGTSMASPQVAGIVALMVGRGQSPSEIRDALIQTAINPAGDPLLGAGIVQADAAVKESTRLVSPLAFALVLLIVGGLAVAVVAWERRRNA